MNIEEMFNLDTRLTKYTLVEFYNNLVLKNRVDVEVVEVDQCYAKKFILHLITNFPSLPMVFIRRRTTIKPLNCAKRLSIICGLMSDEMVILSDNVPHINGLTMSETRKCREAERYCAAIENKLLHIYTVPMSTSLDTQDIIRSQAELIL